MSLGETTPGRGISRLLPMPAPLFSRLAEGVFRRDGEGATQRAAVAAFFIRVASAGIAYVLQVLLARWMGSFEYGIFVFVLAVGLVLRAAMRPVELILNLLGQQEVCAVLLLAALVFKVALNLVLIPSYELMGAAIATSVSMSVAALRMGARCHEATRPQLLRLVATEVVEGVPRTSVQ